MFWKYYGNYSHNVSVPGALKKRHVEEDARLGEHRHSDTLLLGQQGWRNPGHEPQGSAVPRALGAVSAALPAPPFLAPRPAAAGARRRPRYHGNHRAAEGGARLRGCSAHAQCRFRPHPVPLPGISGPEGGRGAAHAPRASLPPPHSHSRVGVAEGWAGDRGGSAANRKRKRRAPVTRCSLPASLWPGGCCWPNRRRAPSANGPNRPNRHRAPALPGPAQPSPAPPARGRGSRPPPPPPSLLPGGAAGPSPPRPRLFPARRPRCPTKSSCGPSKTGTWMR